VNIRKNDIPIIYTSVYFVFVVHSAVLAVTKNVYLFRIYCILRDAVDRLCGLVVGVPGCRSRGPGSIPVATRFSKQ
jgi:hypothetical protein